MSNIDNFIASSGLTSIERNPTENKHHGFLSKVKNFFSHHKEEDVKVVEQEREDIRENVRKVIALAEEERERRIREFDNYKQEEKKERANNLKLVRLLEEQERLRRMKESKQNDDKERQEAKKLVIRLEEEERERRIAEHRETDTQIRQIRVEGRRKSIQLEEAERLRRIQQFQEPVKSTISQRRNSLPDEDKPCATRRLRYSHDGSLDCVAAQPDLVLDKLIKKKNHKVTKNLKSMLREHPEEIANLTRVH